MKNGGIYIIRNNVDNKVYVGSSRNTIKRKHDHFTQLNNNRHCNSYLQSSYNKYGGSNFEFIVIEKIEDQKFLIDREKFYVLKYDSLNKLHGYNLIIQSDSFELSRSLECRLKIQKTMYFKYHKDSTIEEFNEWIKNKIIKSDCKSILVINKDTNVVEYYFPSVASASEVLGVNEQIISKILSKKKKYHKKYVFIYEPEYIENNDYRIFDKERTKKERVLISKEEMTLAHKNRGIKICKKIALYNAADNSFVSEFANKHDVAKFLNVKFKVFDKALYGAKKSCMGYIFKRI